MQKWKGGGRLPEKATITQLLKSFVGGFVSILLLSTLGKFTGLELLMAPFGATCVLLFAVPSSPLAQPRNVIGGHFVSAAIGLLILYTLGASTFTMAIGVGLAIVFMQWLRVIHPPAGANPLVILFAGKEVMHIGFLIFPVVCGSLLLVLVALLINNTGKTSSWPVYWHGIEFRALFKRQK